MTRRGTFCLSVVCLLIGTGSGWSEPQRAVAVSPGGTTELRRIAQNCPSFSWAVAEGSSHSELVVYALGEEQTEGSRARVIHTRVPGTASSWTPSVERCLERGGRYVWYVRSLDELGEGEWSSGRYFEVAPSVGELSEALEVVRRYLANHPEASEGLGHVDEEALQAIRRDLSREGEGASQPEAAPEGDSGIEGAQGRRGGGPELRRRLVPIRTEKRFAALSSNTVGAGPSPQVVTTPSAFSLSIDGDFDLGGFVFKGGVPFLHNDGGSAAYNTALGLNALVSTTLGSPYAHSGKANTAIGADALRRNTSGSGNTASGSYVLRDNTTGYRNTASGISALRDNTTGNRNTAGGSFALSSNTNGYRNTANGSMALYSNTTGSFNTASGFYALSSNTTGPFNTASGNQALSSNTTGFYNTASGSLALSSNTTGARNTASGDRALSSNTIGYYNTASGDQALYFNTTGGRNTAIGSLALSSNTTGSRNTAVGIGAGSNATTGWDNIFLGSGAHGVAGEANTIRIGATAVGTGYEQQNRTFINGIRGVTVANDTAVLIDITTGQLGTVSSSRRFKKEIESMGEASSKLLELRPVTFRYKREPVKGEQPRQFGLIAEEVAEVFPELVVYDEKGRPETVRYHLLSSMLLNELQKQHRQQAQERQEHKKEAALQKKEAAVQKQELALLKKELVLQDWERERLRERLARLEPLVASLAGTRTAGLVLARPPKRSGSP